MGPEPELSFKNSSVGQQGADAPAGGCAPDDAVGVPGGSTGKNDGKTESRHWFVAIVNHNSERLTSEKLGALGYECYVPTQVVVRKYANGRRKKVERVLIPSMVFIRCTEKERLQAVNHPSVFRFLTDRAGSLNRYGKPVAIIPEKQMADLMFMLGHSDAPVDFVEREYCVGDRVRVIRGGLKGLEGIVRKTADGTAKLVILLDVLGGASVAIDPGELDWEE